MIRAGLFGLAEQKNDPIAILMVCKTVTVDTNIAELRNPEKYLVTFLMNLIFVGYFSRNDTNIFCNKSSMLDC